MIKFSIVKEDYEDINNELIFNNNLDKEIILCVGKVQSGKTAKIINIINEALTIHNYDVVIILAGFTNSLYEQTFNRLTKQKIKDVEYIDKNSLKFKKYVQNKKYIISVLKNTDGLDYVDNFIYSIKDRSNRKVLIIDDECDYASVNVSRSDESKTYELIKNIYNFIDQGKLLQVTATPFANLTSIKSPELKCNRIICWDNNQNYTGLLEFDRCNDIYEVLEVDKDDEDTIKEAVKVTMKHTIINLINNYDAIFDIVDNSSHPEISILFNVDLKIEKHNDIYNYIFGAVKEIMFGLKASNFNIPFEQAKKILNSLMDEIEVHILNTKNESVPKKKINIYIGGTLISRGNTFYNLLTELIINCPKNTKISADTLLQRCRWFGYRKDLMPYMKIFMNKNIYEGLKECILYVKLLTPGSHDVIKLKNEINQIDKTTYYVKSTGKD